MQPDLIVDMRINRLVAIWRFTCRFWKAKKLIGKEIDKDLPVQAYHYRRITLEKIRDYDFIGREINAEIAEFWRKAGFLSLSAAVSVTMTLSLPVLKKDETAFVLRKRVKAPVFNPAYEEIC